MTQIRKKGLGQKWEINPTLDQKGKHLIWEIREKHIETKRNRTKTELQRRRKQRRNRGKKQSFVVFFVLIFVCEICGGNRRIPKEERKKRKRDSWVHSGTSFIVRIERFLVFAKG